MPYRLLADLLAALHLAYVAVVVLGLVLIWSGGLLGWKWVGNRWLRLCHLGLIVAVVVRALIWPECPFTVWERDFRILAGQVDAEGYLTYEGSPIGKLLHDLIHPPLPLWVFPVVYIAFAALVLGSFWAVPVRWRSRPEPKRELRPVLPSSSDPELQSTVASKPIRVNDL